jgi:hypothetical protein
MNMAGREGKIIKEGRKDGTGKKIIKEGRERGRKE